VNFEKAFRTIVEKSIKTPKPLTGFDYYKSIRKPTPKPGSSFKDKTKYNRREKYKKDLHESLNDHDYYRQIADILTSYGLKAYEMEPLMKLVQKVVTLAFNEGYKAGTTNPFK